MKYLFSLLLCLVALNCLAQKKVIYRSNGNVDEIDSVFEERSSFQFGGGVSLPQPFGDNFISKGLEVQNIGSNFNFGINILGVLLSLNFEYNEFKVVRPDLIGFYNESEVQSVYIGAGYPILVEDRFELSAIAAYGELDFFNKTNDLQGAEGRLAYLRESAKSYRIGANLDYHLTGGLFAFAQATYNYINSDIETSPRYQSFFQNAHMFNFIVGLKIRFRGMPIGS